jgi:glycosyltransferase involved in cell wall biosynthesis
MNPKICYVLNGVSETSVPATIATALVDYEDIDVDILAWFDAEPFEGDDRVSITCLNAPRETMGLDWRTYRKARETLQDYDLIQAHHNHSGSFAKLIGYRLGIPLVSREGNTRDGFTRKGRIANGVTNWLANRIVPNSHAVYDSFFRWERICLDKQKIKIIPNGVDLDQIDSSNDSDYNINQHFDIPDDAIVVGTASVITEQKALDTLVQGVASANNQSEQRIDLVIAGDGPLRSEIEQLVQKLGIKKNVHFGGMVDRSTVYQILGQIDIYAMPSRWEGFANAAVEALGAKNPCVFSDIDPFLIPYKNVALFHRLDDVNDLAERLMELAENPNIRDFYAQKGRELVEQNYTLKRIARQYVKLYEEILS